MPTCRHVFLVILRDARPQDSGERGARQEVWHLTCHATTTPRVSIGRRLRLPWARRLEAIEAARLPGSAFEVAQHRHADHEINDSDECLLADGGQRVVEGAAGGKRSRGVNAVR